MSTTHLPCEHCGQWIALKTSHYVVIEYNGKKVHAHFNPCMQRVIEQHPNAFIAQEHTNHHRR